MKRWMKLLLALLFVALLTQTPFAYRRHKLRRLRATIEQLNLQRNSPQQEEEYHDYAGVIHVHSFLGGHSSGSFDEIIDAARVNNLKFVVMTEHPAKEFNTAEKTLKGVHAGVLFLNGNEVRTREGDRLLIIPGDSVTGTADQISTVPLLEHAEAHQYISVIAYPDEFKTWSSKAFEGVEVYNVYTDARAINPVVAFFDSLWSFRTYRELVFASFYNRPATSLAKFDAIASDRKVVALAGNDSHANVGMRLSDSSGKTLLGLNLDPYSISFRLVRVHALLPAGAALDPSSLGNALRSGHCFIGFDLLGDTTGFSFVASNSKERRVQGDEIGLLEEVKFTVTSPVHARIILIKNGVNFQEADGFTRQEFVVRERGVYRVELYLPQLPHRVAGQPWIISNPIYVR